MVVGVAEVVAPGGASRMQHVGERHQHAEEHAAAIVSRRAPTPRHSTNVVTGIDNSPAGIPNTNPNAAPAITAPASAGPIGHGAPAGRTGNTWGSRSSRAAVRRDSTRHW